MFETNPLFTLFATIFKKMMKTELSSETETKQLLDNNNRLNLTSVKGLVAAFSVVILHAASATCVQLLQRRIPDLELNAFRCGIPLMFFSIGLIVTRRWPVVEKSEIGVTLLYSLVGSSCKMGEFVAVTFLPAATVSCLFSTSSIIFGLLLFALLLKESVTVQKLLFAAMCICGVILVVQPWKELRTHGIYFKDRGHLSVDGTEGYLATLTGHVNSTEGVRLETNFDHLQVNVSGKATTPETTTVNFTKTSTRVALVSKILGYTAAAAGGILLASEVIIVKRHPYIHEHILETVFWGWSTSTTIYLILMFTIETPVLPSNWFDIVMVIIHCSTCAVIWPLSIYQAKIIAGNTATVIHSTQVVFMLVSQYTVLSSILPGHRNWIEVVGVVLVLLGSSLSSLLEIFFGEK